MSSQARESSRAEQRSLEDGTKTASWSRPFSSGRAPNRGEEGRCPAAACPRDRTACCGLLRNLGCPDPRRRYQRLREIARGGSARIYEVWDANLGRLVAMKTLARRFEDSLDTCLHQSEDAEVSRFVGEAAVMCHLDHAGVVPVYEIGLDHERHLYFTMRLVKGQTLERLLETIGVAGSDWTMLGVLDVLIKVCETLNFAHARGVVHRDLKPSNIMVGRFGQVYVMDWGLSHVGVTGDGPVADHPVDVPRVEVVLRHANRQPTPRGMALGTPRYMSLEQAEGRRTAGHQPTVDVYGVGAILYQVLAEHPPYREVTTMRRLVAALRSGAPPPLPASVPSDLAAICVTAMAPDPRDRYQSMDALARDLAECPECRGVGARRRREWPGFHR